MRGGGREDEIVLESALTTWQFSKFIKGVLHGLFANLALYTCYGIYLCSGFYLRKIEPGKQKLLNNTCTYSILFQRTFILTKSIFILTALAEPLLKIGTIFIKAMLLHFHKISCVGIFMTIGQCSPFWPDVACKAEVHVYCHCLSQAPAEDRYYTHKSNVASLCIAILYTNFHGNWRVLTIQAGKG